MISADRHGMKKTNNDPLAKASFEKSIETILLAATFSDVDKMQSVSSRIYTGQAFKGGTGYCDLAVDIQRIINSEFYDDETKISKMKIEDNTIANAILGNINEEDEDNEDSDDIFIP
jgi:DNA-directed RNA polymerase II subunit RPB1